jgi:hypothetical protein
MNRIGRRTIFAMLLIVALVIVWSATAASGDQLHAPLTHATASGT